MSNKTISFHFSKTKSTISCSSLCRLACQNCPRSTGTSMHFVHDHMLQFLIINRTKEYIANLGFSSNTTIHNFLALVIIAIVNKDFHNVFDVCSSKCCTIIKLSINCCCF
ncbi:unnamed protein product [Meganyctiphanes norvegica]|uniref:Uncharacterized protein n=1 Tax=Meganyctiphanes norvegica TaxID=48144 RepID=A0AAV2RXS9_MEGNR